MNDNDSLLTEAFRKGVGVFGLAAVAIMIMTDLGLALLLKNKSVFSTTISDLAAGDHSLWQDLSLCAIAIAISAIGVVLFLLLDQIREKAGAGLLASVGVIVLILALYNEYGDGQDGGITIHLELVGYIGLGLAVSMCLLAPALSRFRKWLPYITYAAAATWLITGLIFFGASTRFDGLVERAAAAIMLIWLSLICYGFISGNDLQSDKLE